jgi:imidazolonepropionase-like amidohydrolase
MFTMKNSFLLLFSFGLFLTATYGQSTTKNYEFRNGQWFNGNDFTTATWYVSNGFFSKKAPSKIDSVVDLTNRWVVPPFGDAHCSSIADNPNAANVLSQYMGEGVFYLQILGNTQEGRTTTGALVDKPMTPDAIYSNGAITCSLGYPFVEYEGPANGIKNPTQWGQRYDQIKLTRKSLGDGYWFVDNKTALDANWEKIKAQKPSVISIYLLDVLENGGKEGKGLSAEMAKLVLKKAHKAGLRVFAHIETAEDLRLGFKLGVDGFANLPINKWDGTGDGSKYALTDDDLQKLAKKKTPVVTLFSHSQLMSAQNNVKDANAKLLQRLFENNVNLVIGSDDGQRTIRAELNYWFSLGSMDSRQVLKVLCENTPKAIFPKRKIGKIEDGYEASFLVLNDNPMQNILKTRVAAFKVKKGVLLK